MKKLAFVSFEIYPTTKGGAGVFLFNAATVLLQEGNQVVLLLDIPIEEFQQFDQHDRLDLPNALACRAYHVPTLCSDIPYRSSDFISEYVWNSYRFHYACSKLYQIERPQLIEFFDYSGVAYYSLLAKFTGLDYQDAQLAVRLHTSNEVMDVHNPRSIDFAYYTQYDLEHASLRIAEKIFCPSLSFLKEAYQPFYLERWIGETRVSPPPLVHHPCRKTLQQDANIILFYGRLDFLKGADLFVDAAVQALQNGDLNGCQFVLVGGNSFQYLDNIYGESFQKYLEKKIPPQFTGRFMFLGKQTWSALEVLLPKVLFAVFPNRYESFCYAAHELYAAGIPLIVSALPAFGDYFHHNENALVFNFSPGNLAAQMVLFAADPALRKKLSCPYPVVGVQMGNVYAQIDPPAEIVRQNLIEPGCSITYCVLAHGQAQSCVQETLACLPEDSTCSKTIIFLDAPLEAENAYSFYWLGRYCRAMDRQGKDLSPNEIVSGESILILEAGDRVKPEFEQRGRALLSAHPEIGFVGCWHSIYPENRLESFPVDAMIELLPFRPTELHVRCIMRTPKGLPLRNLFASIMGEFGEWKYLWDLERNNSFGIVIPHVLIERAENEKKKMPLAMLSYMIMCDELLSARTARLARLTIPLQIQNISQAVVAPASDPAIEYLGRDDTPGWWLRHSAKKLLMTSPVTERFILKPALYVWRKLKKQIGYK